MTCEKEDIFEKWINSKEALLVICSQKAGDAQNIIAENYMCWKPILQNSTMLVLSDNDLDNILIAMKETIKHTESKDINEKYLDTMIKIEKEIIRRKGLKSHE